MKVIKKRSKNTSIPVKTVTTMMKVIREIPHEELSPKVLEFCGNSTAYEVEEKPISLKKGKIVFLSASGVWRWIFNVLMYAILVPDRR